MPRQSRGRAAPASRPAPAPARHASSVPAHGTAVPPAPVAASGGGSGFFGNMMSTAAGVGIGSAIGHSVGNMLTGGGGHAAAPEAVPQNNNTPGAYDNYAASAQTYGRQGASCEGDAKAFTQCLDSTGGDMQSCSYYLEQLKMCQAAMRA
ncbi:hypothetical protein PYCC9005_002327 [Savitreella phatthalungensis]